MGNKHYSSYIHILFLSFIFTVVFVDMYVGMIYTQLFNV